jgi:hypothetical protein
MDVFCERGYGRMKSTKEKKNKNRVRKPQEMSTVDPGKNNQELRESFKIL